MSASMRGRYAPAPAEPLRTLLWLHKNGRVLNQMEAIIQHKFLKTYLHLFTDLFLNDFPHSSE